MSDVRCHVRTTTGGAGAGMKLRAQITIDIDVDDFIEAADHQRRVALIAAIVRREYSQADLIFRQRRERAGRPCAAPRLREPIHYTGRMREYE